MTRKERGFESMQDMEGTRTAQSPRRKDPELLREAAGMVGGACKVL